ncbi:MAG TPA: hypothetical protein VLC09_15765 [Polyangiaceae bacterium]|nr:hypothetical protein [Polyangiaceae bacterium]
MSRSALLSSALVLWGGLLGACSQQQRERDEARRLIANIEAVRVAPNRDKPAAFAELGRMDCVGAPAACALCRDAFGAYVSALPDSLRLPEQPEARRRALELGASRLRAARTAIDVCTTAEFELARRLKLEVSEHESVERGASTAGQ